ncbi:MAG: hypothetical protein HC836_46630 [Richelia sp. RM2_1_2]|nr:hypothetical protein [Richelia sp. RM2_1_2]
MEKAFGKKKEEMNRLDANRQLLEMLKDLVEKNPELRFGQILAGYGFIINDPQENFYVESTNILARVQKP